MLAPFLGSVFNIGLGVPTATADTVGRVYAQFSRMMSELGGMPLILDQQSSQAVTAHPLGGVPLGLATDLDCRLRGYESLYAVDGSIVPGAAAATISALAQRCMDRITNALAGAP